MKLIPYIMFNGNCEEAVNYYVKTLNGELKELQRYGEMEGANAADKDKILHVRFLINGNDLFMASDASGSAPREAGSGMVHLSLDFKNENEMLNVFSKLADGGTVTMDLQDTFWGAKFGMLTDRFDIKWMFNYDKKK